MNVEEILSRLQGVRKSGQGYVARCPAHDDSNPSLGIALGDGGNILLKCQRGCATESVCAAIGITMADLFPKRNGNGHAERRIVATYDYTDETGKLLYHVHRYEPKTFRQSHKDENGQTVWNMDGVRRVPYRLPELIKGVQSGQTILICEGEKDADNAMRYGFVATCNVGGAGKWRDEYNQFFRGASVVILPDKDKPGREHANAVKDALSEVCKSVKVIELPGTGKDVSDWFAAGGTAEQLRDIIQKPDDHWFDLVEDAADILTRELPPVLEVVSGLIVAMAKFVIGSGSKSFKTWLTMHLALCISHGKPFLGRRTTRQRVLYVNLELKPETFQRRVQVIAKGMEIQVDRAWFYHLPLRGQLSGQAILQIVSRLISVAKALKAGVVVLDPQYKLNMEGDENSSRDQTVLMNCIDRLTTEAGCTVILNDHFGKGNQSEKDPLDAIRGSSAKGGDVDGAMILRRHEADDCFRVDVIHRELPPVEPFCIGWEFPLMHLREDLSPDRMKKPGGRTPEHNLTDLLRLIADTSPQKPISVSSWAQLADIERTTMSGYVSKMRAQGLVGTVGEGHAARKFITEKGRNSIV